MRNHGRHKCCLPRRGFLKPANTNVPAEHTMKGSKEVDARSLTSCFPGVRRISAADGAGSTFVATDLYVGESEGPAPTCLNRQIA
jgi:hypothetical protein